MAARRSVFSRFRSTQQTMMVSFSLLMLVAMLIFLFIALSHTRNVTFENSIELTSTITRQVNDNIDSYFQNMENIASMVTAGSELSFYLFSDGITEGEEVQNKSRIVSQFNTIRETHHDIANIAAVGSNGKFLINDGNESFSDYIDVRSQRWYQLTLYSPGGQVITPTHVQNVIPSSYEWVITLSKALVNRQTGQREGVFFVDLNLAAISVLCNNNTLGSKGYLFIIDEIGDVVYHPKQQLIYGGLITEQTEAILNSDKPYLIYQTNDDSIIYTKSISEKTGWTVIGVNYASDLLKNNRQTQLIYILAMMTLLLAVILISSVISREITRPIRELKDAMQLVEKGEFAKANVDITANNELGSLTKSFNIMTEEIEHLIEQNVIEQQEKRRSEIKALQAQINPHFLYNTLDSIIWMSEAERNEEVVEMTSALARLFRQTISNEKEEVTVYEELEYVRNYLTIQQMRYKDKLEYQIDIEPEIQSVKIIKFAVQPLVENAIYHGLKYKETKGCLFVKGYRDNQNVCIEICDDGVGMNEETLNHIFDEKITDFKKNGVGVNNVQQRLKLYYGEAYGITFQSEPGVGTTGKITIPSAR